MFKKELNEAELKKYIKNMSLEEAFDIFDGEELLISIPRICRMYGLGKASVNKIVKRRGVIRKIEQYDGSKAWSIASESFGQNEYKWGWKSNEEGKSERVIKRVTMKRSFVEKFMEEEGYIKRSKDDMILEYLLDKMPQFPYENMSKKDEKLVLEYAEQNISRVFYCLGEEKSKDIIVKWVSEAERLGEVEYVNCVFKVLEKKTYLDNLLYERSWEVDSLPKKKTPSGRF